MKKVSENFTENVYNHLSEIFSNIQRKLFVKIKRLLANSPFKCLKASKFEMKLGSDNFSDVSKDRFFMVFYFSEIFNEFSESHLHLNKIDQKSIIS